MEPAGPPRGRALPRQHGRRASSPSGFHTDHTLRILLGKEHEEVPVNRMSQPPGGRPHPKPSGRRCSLASQASRGRAENTADLVVKNRQDPTGPSPTPGAHRFWPWLHLPLPGRRPRAPQPLWPPQGGGCSSLRFREGSKVLWGFLSCFFCLFLDRMSVLPSSSSSARLLRAPVFSLLPSLGLQGQGSGQGSETP